MSRSPEESRTDRSSLQAYQDSWEALYNLVDEGKSWSGRERNCAFLNVNGKSFADISAASGLDLIDDGRAIAVADWDFDGRLDFWVTNRTAPRVRFLHNAGESRERFVAFSLTGTNCNRDAIGARLELHSGAEKQIRTLHAGDGYLSQSSKWIHFGLPRAGGVHEVVVRWPGGEVERVTGIEAGKFYRIVEGEGKVVEWQPPERHERVALREAPIAIPSRSSSARVWVTGRIPFPGASYESWDGAQKSLGEFGGQPLLLNLWSGYCAPCLEELEEWESSQDELREAGLQILALCVDQEPPPRSAAGRSLTSGVATKEFVQGFEALNRALVESRKPLPVPSSVLLDANQNVAAIYKGRVSVERLRTDVALLEAPPEVQRAAAVPFEGRWMTPPLGPMPRQVIGTFVKAGQMEAARAYTRRCLDPGARLSLSPSVRASLTLFLGDLHLDDGELDEAVPIYARLFELAPRDAGLHREVALRLVTKQRVAEAIAHLQRVVEIDPGEQDARLNLASLQLRQGRVSEAIDHFRELVKQRPDVPRLHFFLANALQTHGDTDEAVSHYRAAHRLQPNSPASNNLAWILATHEDDAVRDGQEAVKLAEAACRAKNFQDPVLLHTLAAAFAERGDFPEAVSAAEKALSLARAGGAQPALLDRISQTLEACRAGQPIRD